MATGTDSGPCGACRFLRRKCTAECVFAPYFCLEQDGPARFAAIHKVFGASNVSKLLWRVPANARREAILTVDFEAQSRIKDPVYGCVSHVLALQQQVECLQYQVMEMEAKLAQNLVDDHSSINQWPINNNTIGSSEPLANYTVARQLGVENCRDVEQVSVQRQRPSHTDLSDLHELALRMMRNEN